MRRTTVQGARTPAQLYVLNRFPLIAGRTAKVYSTGGDTYEFIPASPILTDGLELDEKLLLLGTATQVGHMRSPCEETRYPAGITDSFLCESIG
jgi:hypothetical protein